MKFGDYKRILWKNSLQNVPCKLNLHADFDILWWLCCYISTIISFWFCLIEGFASFFINIKEPENSFHRPLNSHNFIVCHTVSLPFSRSHSRFFVSHGFTNFEWILSKTHNFLKNKHRWYIPIMASLGFIAPPLKS